MRQTLCPGMLHLTSRMAHALAISRPCPDISTVTILPTTHLPSSSKLSSASRALTTSSIPKKSHSPKSSHSSSTAIQASEDLHVSMRRILHHARIGRLSLQQILGPRFSESHWNKTPAHFSPVLYLPHPKMNRCQNSIPETFQNKKNLRHREGASAGRLPTGPSKEDTGQILI